VKPSRLGNWPGYLKNNYRMELKWFKFSPVAWAMGKISKQKEAVQVAFIRLMCKYWTEGGVMLAEDAKEECGSDKYDKLIAARIVKLNSDGTIRIDFLDEQLDEIKKDKGFKSKAGKASAEARKRKSFEQVLNKNEQAETIVEQNPTDKIDKIDKIEESVENNTTPHTLEIQIENSIADFDTLIRHSVDNPAWTGLVEENMAVPANWFKSYAEAWFKDKQTMGDYTRYTVGQLKKYCLIDFKKFLKEQLKPAKVEDLRMYREQHNLKAPRI
jgi:hypothetical protein